MKKILMVIMAMLYIAAGVNHFILTPFYAKTIETFLPYATILVYVSGVVEILLGVGLLIPSYRRYAAWGIVALLIAVYPANIYMALHPEIWHLPPLGLWLRLPLQFVFIYWALSYTKK